MQNLTKGTYRSHVLSEIQENLIGQDIKVAGWIRKKRNHGKILFIDLIDESASLQCIVDQDNSIFNDIESIPLESVISFEGKILKRSDQTINDQIATGKIELEIKAYKILSKAQPLPFAINQKDLNEELALEYRFLSLRKKEMQDILKTRTQIIDLLRKYMKELGFLEIQTPILSAGSPEGARDYIVPSRLHPGKFYALPQAPQQFKQLLMTAGFEKYFQIAPCFRDEDSRADRLIGEFYQLDFEMAYATQEDVFQVLEHVFYNVFKTIKPDFEVPQAFPRITYKNAIETYGSDKPDLRNPLILKDITELCKEKNSVPGIFQKSVAAGSKMIVISAFIENKSNKFFNDMQEFMKQKGASGLAWTNYNDQKWSGTLANMINDEIKNQITKNTNHNTIFLLTDTAKNVYKLAGYLRDELGKQLNLIIENAFKFCLITDFPMFEWNENKKGENKWDFMHNPFSMPQNIENENIDEILSYQYDIVCNGYELSSGAVRNHDLETVKKVFQITGDNLENLEQRFPLFKAFKFGVPPHAGSAPGIDRIVMLLTGSSNVRNIVAFPLNQNGESLLMEAPNQVDEEFLKTLNLKIEKKITEEVK